MSDQDAALAETAATATGPNGEIVTVTAAAPQDAAETSSDDQDTPKPRRPASDDLKADLAKERRQRQALEKQLKEIEDAKLKAERLALRQQVAIKHQLTPDLAKRLQGETEDELDADGAELAKLLAPKGPRPDLTQGSRADRSGPVDMNQLIRSAARRG